MSDENVLPIDALANSSAISTGDATALSAVEGVRADTPAPVALAGQVTPDQAPAIPRRVLGDSIPANIRLESIEYTSAHNKIFLKNEGDLGGAFTDPAGMLLGKIDRAPSGTAPPFIITHTRNTPMHLKAWFVIDPPESGMVSCTVTAVPNKAVQWGSSLPVEDRGLSFSSVQVAARGPRFLVELRSVDPNSQQEIPLMDKVKSLRNIELIWKVELLVLGSADAVPMRLPYGPWISKVDIFLTMGVPIDTGKVSRPEDGVTTERLKRAFSFIENLDTRDAHSLCAAMLPKFGKIVLKPNSALTKFSHPDYFENKASVKGGAWNLIEHLADGERGECQAIVRSMRAILYLVGAIEQPEQAAIVVIFARPDDAAVADKAIEDSELDATFLNSRDVIETGGLHAFTKQEMVGGSPEKWQAMLMSRVIKEGDKLPQSEGFNFYEAALKVNSKGKIAYYAGGLFTSFSSNDAILKIHVALCWVTDTDNDPITLEPRKVIRKFIQGYRDFNRVKFAP